MPALRILGAELNLAALCTSPQVAFLARQAPLRVKVYRTYN